MGRDWGQEFRKGPRGCFKNVPKSSVRVGRKKKDDDVTGTTPCLSLRMNQGSQESYQGTAG
jgi:hypothetical protein